jgi:NADH pyrophosphatase NudC (nudix superfamily)
MIVTKYETRKVCPNGHKFVPTNWAGHLDFCPDCGTRLIIEIREIKEIQCPKCGSNHWCAEWKFCGYCGHELTQAERKDFDRQDVRQD